MKITHYSLLFLAIFILGFFMFAFYGDQVIDSNNTNVVEEQSLLASTDSALEKGEIEKELIFADEDTRWLAVGALENIYGQNHNTVTEDTMVTNKYHLSTTFIVDWNGYYMEYENSYKGADGKSYSKEEMTELNTWTETYGNYVINYRLDNNITVYYNQGEYNGDYKDIYNSLGNPAELSFMNSEESFVEEKNITIATIMNEQINYYANTKNTWFNTYDANYLITINSAYDSDVESVLDMPCVIALSQGEQTLTYRNYTDIFAFTASDLVEKKNYYIQKDANGELYYHTKDCPDVTDLSNKGVLKDCAKEGAYPHDCVYLN